MLVGHSNGCDLIARVLEACGAEIDAAHLISPAADEEDFAEAIREGLVRRIHIYGSRHDGALRFAAYAFVLLAYAWQGAPLSLVAPLRETGILVAVWLGGSMLGEEDRNRRLLASVGIVLGGLLLVVG